MALPRTTRAVAKIASAVVSTFDAQASQSVWRLPCGGRAAHRLDPATTAWWCAFTGQSQRACTARGGHGWLDAVHPQDRAIARRTWRLILRDGAYAVESEYRVRRRDAAWRWLQVRGRPVCDVHGTTIEWTGTVSDVTERKQVQLALDESEARFRISADHAPVLIWMSGIDGQCTWFNQPWLDFVGRTMAQEIGEGWVQNVHRDDLRGCLETYREAFAARREFRMEYRLRRGDGEYRWLLDHGVPRYTGEAFVGFIGSCVDITERKHLEDDLVAAKFRLAADLGAMSRLHAIGARLADHTDLPTLFNEIIEAARDITGADMGTIQLRDQTGALRIAAHQGFHQPFRECFEHLHDEASGACGAALTDGERVIIEDVQLSPVTAEGGVRRIMREAGVRAVQSTPLRSRSGKVLGFLSTHRRRPGRPGERELAFLDLLARQAADFVDRDRADAEIRESQARLAAIVSSAMDAIITTDREHRIVLFNTAAEHVFGYQAKDVLGRSLDLLIPERYRASHEENVRTFDETGAPSRMMGSSDTMFARRADGTEFPIETSISRVELDGQKFFTVILRDITARLRTTYEHARLAAIVESSEDVIFSRTLDGTITSWNRSAERLYGYTASGALGKSVCDLIVPPDRMEEPARVTERLRRGESVEPFETLHRRKDGSTLCVSVTVSPVKSPAGDVVGVSSIARDITRRKAMEQALRQSEQALADFFAESPLGLLWITPEGRVERVNRAQLEVFGRAMEEVLGAPVARWFAKPELARRLLRRLEKGETVADERARLRRPDGSLVHVLIDANGLWRDGHYVHSRWFMRDVTSRVGLQREVLAIAERERLRLGQDLHDDLCQQLSGIQFLSETLAGTLDDISKSGAKRAREIGRLVQRSMDRARELAHGLAPMSLEHDGLMAALRGLSESTRRMFRRECRFTCEKPVLIPDQTVSANLFRIAQEAVSNAIRHGKARRIDLSLGERAGRPVLTVRDNGVGLPMKPGKRSGMGLRVMQYRASSIGAVLKIDRAPTGGTRVVCTLGAGE